MTPRPGAVSPVPPHRPLRPTRRSRQLYHLRQVVHAVLHSPLAHGMIDGRICELRYASPVTGRHVTVPVMYARAGEEVIVLIPATDGDRWSRTFAGPYPVRVLLHRQWRRGIGRMFVYGQTGWRAAADAYGSRYPSIPVEEADTFVVIRLRPLLAREGAAIGAVAIRPEPS